MSFGALIVHNVTVRKLRLALTALAVAIGVVTVVSLGVRPTSQSRQPTTEPPKSSGQETRWETPVWSCVLPCAIVTSLPGTRRLPARPPASERR